MIGSSAVQQILAAAILDSAQFDQHLLLQDTAAGKPPFNRWQIGWDSGHMSVYLLVSGLLGSLRACMHRLDRMHGVGARH